MKKLVLLASLALAEVFDLKLDEEALIFGNFTDADIKEVIQEISEPTKDIESLER